MRRDTRHAPQPLPIRDWGQPEAVAGGAETNHDLPTDALALATEGAVTPDSQDCSTWNGIGHHARATVVAVANVVQHANVPHGTSSPHHGDPAGGHGSVGYRPRAAYERPHDGVSRTDRPPWASDHAIPSQPVHARASGAHGCRQQHGATPVSPMSTLPTTPPTVQPTTDAGLTQRTAPSVRRTILRARGVDRPSCQTRRIVDRAHGPSG